jgi:hypothetical protein
MKLADAFKVPKLVQEIWTIMKPEIIKKTDTPEFPSAQANRVIQFCVAFPVSSRRAWSITTIQAAIALSAWSEKKMLLDFKMGELDRPSGVCSAYALGAPPEMKFCDFNGCETFRFATILVGGALRGLNDSLGVSTERLRCASDLSEAEWTIVAPHLTGVGAGGTTARARTGVLMATLAIGVRGAFRRAIDAQFRSILLDVGSFAKTRPKLVERLDEALDWCSAMGARIRCSGRSARAFGGLDERTQALDVEFVWEAEADW